MRSDAPKICLNMIVRNEAAIIERCLSSVAPYISTFLILDTGSTDETPNIIRSFFDNLGIPGEVHIGEFVNFSTTRNRALELLERSSLNYEYVILIDADMELLVEENDWTARLSEPVYALKQHNTIAYDNIRLFRRDVPARYVGVTHEHLDTNGHSQISLKGLTMLDHACGANRVGKFDRDAALLLQGLEDEPDNARYVFYLAQSYRDAGKLDLAYTTYTRRVSMGGWEEEVFVAQFEKGRLAITLGLSDTAITSDLLEAYDLRSTRAEPLHSLAAYYRKREMWPRAYLFAHAGSRIQLPQDRLFVHTEVYGWMLLDELAVAAYWVGRYEESAQACAAILQKVAHGLVLDEATQARVRENAEFARVKLIP
ncbi:MAG: glycosyltransferase [Halioglobus sp.]